MGQNYDMSETCRLCDENCISMHSVFERVPEGQQVLQLIKDCLRILIYRTDPLPKQICDSCYTNLLNFSSFKRVTHENLDRQREKLRECNLENSVSVQLYLNALEQNDCQGSDNPLFTNSHDNDSGYYNKEDKDNNESEMCAQLQKAIKDSLRSSKIQENHLEQGKLSNGHIELQDEDSQTSSKLKEQNSESPYSLYQNAESQSDMELCDSDSEYLPKIIVTSISLKRRRVVEDDDEKPTVKRRRFVGPQSRVQQRKNRYLRSLYKEKFGKKVAIVYNPLSLLKCALNTINQTNVPDYQCENFETAEVNNITDEDLKDLNESEDFFLEDENICNYCDRVFFDSSSLATHECNHMYVVLGEKVDNSKAWNGEDDESFMRNKWWSRLMKEKRLSHFGKFREKIVSNFDDSTGRVNVLNPDEVEFKEPEQTTNNALPFLAKDGTFLKGEVVLIDTQATINGIPLSDLPKDGRRTIYKSVTVNGVKRKFCPLCRYTFKDNWAIESHYFSTACHYTCRFCGVRFNKQRTEFDAHIKNHIMCGDTHTTNIFASRKFQTTPKIINASHVKDRPPPAPRQPAAPKIKPIKMKNLLEKQAPAFQVKQEIEDDSYGDVAKSDGSQNQAYFCRKCYQVFHKLDEFNVHNVNCNGTAYSNSNNTITSYQPNTKYHSNRPEPEKFSPAGRPMRNCVKEIGTYADDMVQEDVDYTPFRRLNHGKSARGYECALCSSCFPTVHSRNSHMRIHKSAFHELSNRSITITKSQKSHIAKKMADMMERHDSASFNRYVNNMAIKQEPMEPIVEIHETGSNNFPSSIGSVSITPIPNATQRSLDPNIMRLVQNNPNITIKSMGDPSYNNHSRSIPSPSLDGDGKCYRCLSCSKPFANKSNLYFHKKNQCSGSKYPCPFCKKRFGTEAAYSSHIFYNHPE